MSKKARFGHSGRLIGAPGCRKKIKKSLELARSKNCTFGWKDLGAHFQASSEPKIGAKSHLLAIGGGVRGVREKRQRTRTGRGPDAGRTIEFEETDADRTRTGRGRGPLARVSGSQWRERISAHKAALRQMHCAPGLAGVAWTQKGGHWAAQKTVFMPVGTPWGSDMAPWWHHQKV
eukprot:gene14224-biopygen6565